MSGRIYSILQVLTLGLFACNPPGSPGEEVAYNYSLVDINSTSDTYGQTMSPGYFENQVTLHYFGHQD